MSDMASPMKFFFAADCCAFCHERFPPQSLLGFDAWQSDIRAVLYLDTNGEGSIEVTEPTRLTDIDDDIDVALSSRLRSQTITISRDPRVDQKCRAHRLAFCFHAWCYSILIWKLKGYHTSLIYKLARTLTPDPSLWEDVPERRYKLDSARRLQIVASHKMQPLCLSRFPIELRTYIWRYVGLTTPYSAFILVTGETSRLARHLYYPLSRDVILQRGSRLSANMVSVFGTEYIQGLVMDRYCDENPRPFSDTIGVRYITGCGGLCAIQLLGIDWESGWIGKIPTGDCIWHGRIRGRVSTLRCDYNNINCVAISLPGHIPRKEVVWDQPDFPTTLLDPDAALFDFNRDIVRSTTIAPKRRFFRYLSLYSEDEYTKGLSIYVSSHGIVGLEAHFTSTSRVTGDRSGCALHFPLYPAERIAHAWLRIVNSPSPAFAAPALTIQTTTGRIHSFGSYVLPSLVISNNYKWIFLPQRGCVAGLYYENVNSGTTIMRLGVTGDDTPPIAVPLSPQYHNCGFPSPPIGSPNAGLFLSFAILSGLERVDTCHVDKRCTGMLIHYFDGHTMVLGQWHASSPSQHSCIYNSSGPAFPDLFFRMSKSGNHQIVTNISFSPDTVETTPESNYQVFKAGEHIAWWFSERYDKVLRWTGDLQRIPEESIMIKHL